MAAAELDHLFAAIQRTRDPELLAVLFERTAPWLLHRARLLLRPGLAEDVVQDLFVCLLENGHGCDPGRPCLPFLLGMLHRRAARVRRREARTLAQGLRAATAVEAGPADAAIGAEARAAVRGAIEALPEPYREVVRRYAAQRSPQEIGRELGRTANAVRVQLHRGLRMLRAALPPVLLLSLWAVPVRPVAAQAMPRRSVRTAAAAVALAALTAGLVCATGRGDVVAHTTAAGYVPARTVHEPERAGDGAAAPPARTAAGVIAVPALELALRHADGSAAAGIGVVAHRAGGDCDFGAVHAVSGADGVVVLPDLPAGTATVRLDRGVQLECRVPAPGAAPQVVTVPVGVAVTGVVRDAEGRPAAGAGVWLCRDARTPTEGCVVAYTRADGTFELRDVPPAASLAAVRDGSIPSPLHGVGPEPGAIELVLGGAGARVAGRVLGADGAPVAGAIVRIGAQPRANFHLPGGAALDHAHPCATVYTGAAGTFAVADLPPGALQVHVRAPGHTTRSQPVALAPGTTLRVDVRLRAGVDLAGDVRDEHGAAIAGASVLARGVVRSAWAHAETAPDGSFALVGLDPDHVQLDVGAPGFAPASFPVARGAGPVAVVLSRERRVVVHLQDASGAAAVTGWELAAQDPSRGGSEPPEPLAAAGDGFVAAGERSGGPFVVRRAGTRVWLRAEAGADPQVLRVPAAAEHLGALRLSLHGATPEQRRSVVLALERDGMRQGLVAVDPDAEPLDFGEVPAGDWRVVLYSRGGVMPAIDLGTVSLAANGTQLSADVPAHGWVRYRLRRADREPVVHCHALVADRRGLTVPLAGAEGRIALATGRHQLWVNGMSFLTAAHVVDVTAAQETVIDVELIPAKVRHVAFRLPPGSEPDSCRASVRAVADAARGGQPAFPLADRGFDSAPGGLCHTTLVLADGEHELVVQCGGGRVLRSRFAITGDAGVAEPLAVELDDG